MKENKYNDIYLTPEVDIYENENEFMLKAEMPGVQKDGIEINVEDDQLVILGHVGSYYKDLTEKSKANYRDFELADYKRVFSLSNTVEVDQIKAAMENGILSLTLPKSAKIKPRKIAITSG